MVSPIMIYTEQNIDTLDLNKYNRLITLGCSFTRYRWATWADLLAAEMPSATHINQAQSGAGNMYISTCLSQLSRTINLGAQDLVVIMWSTFYRQDFYKDSQWITPGNIYTQGIVPMDYVERFYEPRGMMLRDLALIDTTMKSVQHAEFDCVAFMGVSIDGQNYYSGQDDAYDISSIKSLYGDLPVMNMDLLTVVGGEWKGQYEYTNHDGSQFSDYHPTPYEYRNFLVQCGFPMGDSSRALAETSDKLMQTVKTFETFGRDDWPWQDVTGPVI
jgi:hypothetical protein